MLDTYLDMEHNGVPIRFFCKLGEWHARLGASVPYSYKIEIMT
jgi:hypothetical protein